MTTYITNIKQLNGILSKEKLFLQGKELNSIKTIKNAFLKLTMK